MTLRKAYPDELARAHALLSPTHEVPKHAHWMVAVQESPVERLMAVLAWWPKDEIASNNEQTVLFAWANRGQADPKIIGLQIDALETEALECGAGRIKSAYAVNKEHPLHDVLLDRNYCICRTYRNFMMPGDTAIARTRRIYHRIEKRIPSSWQVESLFDQDPAAIFALLETHALMPRDEFQKRWNSTGASGFNNRYSVVVTEGGKLVGLYLLSEYPDDVLRVHAEVAAPAIKGQTGAMSCFMRHVSLCRYPEGFPSYFSSTALKRNTQAQNTPLRLGGTQSLPLHIFEKNF